MGIGLLTVIRRNLAINRVNVQLFSFAHKDIEQLNDIFRTGSFIQTDAQSVRTHSTQVAALFQSPLENSFLLTAYFEGQGVKKGVVALKPHFRQPMMKNPGETVNPLSNGL